MLGNVQGKRRLAHTGTGGNENKVRRLEARSQTVKVLKPGRDAGNAAAGRIEFFDFGKGVENNSLNRGKIAAHLAVGHFQNHLFRLVKNDGDFLIGLIAHAGNLGRRIDQLAEERLFFDNFGMINNVSRRRHAVGQGRYVGNAAGRFEFFFLAQHLGDSDDVHRLVAVEKVQNRLINEPVSLPVKVLGTQKLGHLGNGLTFDKHRAENGLFGFHVLGRYTV